MKKAMTYSTLYLILLLVSTLPASDTSPFQHVTLPTPFNTQASYLMTLGKYKVWSRIPKYSKKGEIRTAGRYKIG